MITREQAQKEASRFDVSATLVPKSIDGKRELLDCMIRHATDERHLRQIITAILDTPSRPGLTITARIAEAARETKLAGPHRPRCSGCNGDGWVSTWFQVTRNEVREVTHSKQLGRIGNEHAEALTRQLALTTSDEDVVSAACRCPVCGGPPRTPETEGR